MLPFITDDHKDWNSPTYLRVTAADTGEPLRNVAIVLSGALTRDFVDVTRTDVNGDYQFTALAAKAYQLQALTSFSFGEASVPYVNQNYPDVVNLSDPGVRSGIDFNLARGAQASGRVTEVGSGQGIANATVLLSRTSDSALAGLVRTDASGNYTTAGLVPGSYTLTFNGNNTNWAGFSEATRVVEIVATSSVSGIDAQLERLSKVVAYLPLAGNP